MMMGMGIPSSHKRIGIGSSFRSAPHQGRGTRRFPFHFPSRSCPPSTAARLAAKAPNSSEAVIQKASFAAPRRALSAAALASVITRDIGSVGGGELAVLSEAGGP